MAESEATTLYTTNLELEELRCSICKEYLLCSPVRLLRDGTCICGNCSPLTSDVPIYRVLPLEAVLRKVSFPCQFKKYGCTENVLFGKAVEHQNQCRYRPFTCPALTPCSWKGLQLKLYDHFTEQHTDLIKERAEFNFDVDQNSEGVFMAVEDSCVFFVKYVYNSNEMNFKYDIRFCANKIGYNVSFKSQLINALDTECRVILKTNKCSLYDQGFYELQDGKFLNIGKFLHSLGDPPSIVIVLELKIVKSCNDNKETKNSIEVNYDLIKSLKCNICKYYLIPPLFELNSCAVYCNCAKINGSCTLSMNADLLKLVNEAAYPCRWRDCDFVAISEDLKGHERVCQFRRYNCTDKCDDTFKLPELINHVREIHKTECSDKIVYKTSLAKKSDSNFIFTIKESVPVIIIHTSKSDVYYNHHIKVFSDEDSAKITCILEFEHLHCKVKSREFVVRQGLPLRIKAKELPSCFKQKEKLTVTVKVNIE